MNNVSKAFVRSKISDMQVQSFFDIIIDFQIASYGAMLSDCIWKTGLFWYSMRRILCVNKV